MCARPRSPVGQTVAPERFAERAYDVQKPLVGVERSIRRVMNGNAFGERAMPLGKAELGHGRKVGKSRPDNEGTGSVRAGCAEARGDVGYEVHGTSMALRSCSADIVRTRSNVLFALQVRG